MKIVLFEFRKNILRKTVIIPMIILLIVNVIVIYAQYRFQNDPFSSEVNRYHSSAREWKYYKELHTQFDGEITEEKQDKIIKLYNNLKEKVDDGDYEKGYTKSAGTGYIFGDRNEFLSANQKSSFLCREKWGTGRSGKRKYKVL